MAAPPQAAGAGDHHAVAQPALAHPAAQRAFAVSAAIDVRGVERITAQRVDAVQQPGDDAGAFVQIAFSLPAGAYATVVLREVMKNEVGEEE